MASGSTPAKRRIIDFRARPSLARYMTFFESKGAQHTMKNFGLPVAPIVTLDEFMAGVDQAGIELIVFTGRDAETKRGWFYPNDDIVAAVRQFPKRIVGYAGIDPLKGKRAIDEIDRCVDLGLRGVSLDPSGVGEMADDRRFYPVYERCLEHRIPVAITLGPVPSPWAGPMRMNSPMGVDQVACDFPDLTIICSHLGWPWITEMIAIAWRHPNVYIEDSVYRYMPGCEQYIEAANTILADKFIFASGYPFDHPLDAVVKKFLTLPYKPDVMDKILYRNAARLLGLDA